MTRTTPKPSPISKTLKRNKIPSTANGTVWGEAILQLNASNGNQQLRALYGNMMEIMRGKL